MREGAFHALPSLPTNEGLDAIWLQIIRAIENRAGEAVLLNCSALRYYSDVNTTPVFPGKSKSCVGLSPGASVVKADMNLDLQQCPCIL